MPSVFRSTVLLGALALGVTSGLTACGDKITQTTAKDTSVQSVLVSPPGPVPMKVGDKVTFAASVTGGADLVNRAVTWKSSASNVATVDANGLVTAVAGGTASIIATSVANTGVSGAAVVTVAATVNASVTIGQINQTICNPTCASVPATLSNVFGQLDVTLQVDPGTQTVSEVDLIMNCTGNGNSGADTVVFKSTSGTSDLAPLTAEAAASPVAASFNTGAFNATTGVVAFKNGPCTLKAKAITNAGSVSANNPQPMTLNNVNFIVPPSLANGGLTTVPTGTQIASAIDGNGLSWRAGAVTVSAVAVFYTGGSIAAGSITLINSGNDAALGKSGAVVNGGTAVATQSGTVTNGVLGGSFPMTTATGGVLGAVVDTLSVTVTTVDNLGNAGPQLLACANLTCSPANFIRLDNRAPDIANFGAFVITAPAFNAGTQNTSNGWVGKNFVFTVGSTAGPSGQAILIGSAGTDNQVAISAVSPNSTGGGGVDKITVATQSAPQGTTAWTTFTNVSALAETPAATGPVAYDLRLVICDALGNCVNTTPTFPVLTTFGVDLTAPTAIKGSTPADKETVGIGQALSSTTLQVAGTDPQGANGVTGSGFGSNPVLVQANRLTSVAPAPAGGQTNICVIGTAASPAGSGCKAPFAANAFPSPQAVALNPNATAIPGQYSVVFQVTDQAGNFSPLDSVRYYIDQVAPGMSGGISIPASITNGAVFTASGIDDMDFVSVNAVLTYPGLPNPSLQIAGTSSAAGVTFDNVLTRSSTATITLSNFIRQLGTMDAGGVVAGETKPSQIGIRGVDGANNLSLPDVAAFPATNIATGTSLAGTTVGFKISTSKTTLANGANPGAIATTSTLADTVYALNANAGTPFSQVCFYVSNPLGAQNGQADPVSSGAAGELFLLGCTSTTTTILDGAQKKIASSISFDPNALYGTSALLSLWAVGITAAGDATITAAPVTIQLVP